MLEKLSKVPRKSLEWKDICFGLATACDEMNTAVIGILVQTVRSAVEAGARVIYQPAEVDNDVSEILSRQLESKRELEHLVTLKRKIDQISVYSQPRCCQGRNGLLKQLAPLICGVLIIAEKPFEAGVWLMDAIQDMHIEKGYGHSGIATDMLEYVACGSLFNHGLC
jgi:hypothetical protein